VDSISASPARNQVEHAGRSQVNVIRSSNSGLDRIALDDRWEGEGFPVFPLLRGAVGLAVLVGVAPRLGRVFVCRPEATSPGTMRRAATG
jgi:hypothetical protein